MNQRAGLIGRLLVPAAVGMITLTGCATTTAGSAARDPGVQPGVVDLALLEPGNYPTKPRPPLGAAGTAEAGALLEAQRLAEYVTGPWEVDPALVQPISFYYSPGSIALLPDSMDLVFTPKSEVSNSLMRHGVINGYAAGRWVKDQRSLTNVVLRFADPATAVGAAAEAGRSNPVPADSSSVPTLTPVTIPGHPDAVANSYTWTDSTKNLSWTTVSSFTARGPFVLFQRSEVVGPVDVALGLIGKTLDLQGPAIDTFTPTDPAQFATLPRDPSGLLALSLPVPKDGANLVNNLTTGAHGTLHFEMDPVAAAKVFAAAGLDATALADGWVSRARDAAGAAALLADSVRDADGAVAGVPNLPGSRCFQATDRGRSNCSATVGRYFFEVWGHTLKDTQQKAAAQYLLLAAA